MPETQAASLATGNILYTNPETTLAGVSGGAARLRRSGFARTSLRVMPQGRQKRVRRGWGTPKAADFKVHGTFPVNHRAAGHSCVFEGAA